MAGQVDNYPGQDAAITAPASDAGAITPANDALLARIPKGLHNAGTAGTIAVKFGSSSSPVVTFHLLQGHTLYIRPKIIMATGTTAGAVVALY
jgi:hypothetical protein